MDALTRTGLAWLMLPLVASGQVIIQFTPEVMAVPTAVIANARQMGRWRVDMCNTGAVPVVLPIQRVMMASGVIPLIDPQDAALVLSANVRRSGPARAVRILGWGMVGVGIATSLIAMRNAGNSTEELMSQVKWLRIGSAVSAVGTAVPVVMDALKAEVPDAAPLLTVLKWPLMLAPGSCETEHFFAGKMRSPRAVTAVIP